MLYFIIRLLLSQYITFSNLHGFVWHFLLYFFFLIFFFFLRLRLRLRVNSSSLQMSFCFFFSTVFLTDWEVVSGYFIIR